MFETLKRLPALTIVSSDQMDVRKIDDEFSMTNIEWFHADTLPLDHMFKSGYLLIRTEHGFRFVTPDGLTFSVVRGQVSLSGQTQSINNQRDGFTVVSKDGTSISYKSSGVLCVSSGITRFGVHGLRAFSTLARSA